MDDREHRMSSLVELLLKSNRGLYGRACDESWDVDHVRITGFVPYSPWRMEEAVLQVSRYHGSVSDCTRGLRGMSVDMGCGNGGWALFAATAGYNSYGIDINPLLIDEACRLRDVARADGIISSDVACEFAVGNMYPSSLVSEYVAFGKKMAFEALNRGPLELWEKMVPVDYSGVQEDAYAKLGISLSNADVVYAYCWPDANDFLRSALLKYAKNDCVFVLPSENFSSPGLESMRIFGNETRDVFIRSHAFPQGGRVCKNIKNK